MDIFLKKWVYFSVGCISVLILFFLKWWLGIIGLVFLLYTHPRMADEFKKQGVNKNAPKYCLIILIAMPLICGFIISAAQSSKEDRIKEIAAEETYRLENALVWNIESDPSLSEKEKIFVKSAANNLIANEKTCNEIIMGGQSTVQKNNYYLQCKTKSGGYFKIYFTEDELVNGRVLKIIEPYSEKESADICFQRQWNAIKFPDTMKTISWEKDVTYTNGDRKIEQVFSAQNAYGMAVRNRMFCIVNSNGAVVEFKITEE